MTILVCQHLILVHDQWDCIVEVVDAERRLSDEEQLALILELENAAMEGK
jgi:hypothetical protein